MNDQDVPDLGEREELPMVKAIKEKFTVPDLELPGPESVDALKESPLDSKELNEGLLREFYLADEAVKKAEKILAPVKAEVKALVKADRGLLMRGQFGVEVTERKGAEKTDWEAVAHGLKNHIEEQMGKAEANSLYLGLIKRETKKGEPTIALKPMKA